MSVCVFRLFPPIHPANSSKSYRTQLGHHLIQLRIGGVPNLLRLEAPDDVELPLVFSGAFL